MHVNQDLDLDFPNNIPMLLVAIHFVFSFLHTDEIPAYRCQLCMKRNNLLLALQNLLFQNFYGFAHNYNENFEQIRIF